MKNYQVVIVGGGPVGMALAIELGRRGTSCALVERRTTKSIVPKGQSLQQRTMELFRAWGIADELRAARTMPAGYPIGDVIAYGNLMSDIWTAPAGRELVNTYFCEPNERLPQYQTEEVLRARLEKETSVDVYRGWQVSAFEEHDDHVVATLELGGERVALQAAYLVGCDGGRSIVRDGSGIPQSGSDFDQVMGLAVFRSPELHDLLNRFPERSAYRVIDPALGGYWEFLGRVDVGESFFFHAPLPVPEPGGEVDVDALLFRAVGREFAYELDHFGRWDLRVRVAEEYRAGRIFIAGDAAHTHPPYGGFGLNNGLEDAVNLGWKLAAVLDGWAHEAILDTYSAERRPVFREIAEDIITAGIRQEREFLQAHGPEQDGAEFADLFRAETSRERKVRGYEPHYDGSLIVWAPPEGTTGALGEHRATARPGHHLAPHRLTTGEEVFDRLGVGFTLLVFDVPAATVAGIEEAAEKLRIPFELVREPEPGAAHPYGSSLVLVRPDHYVAWAGDLLPTEPLALLRRVAALGHPESTSGGAV